ncbi:MAG TPA: ribokinase [Chryseolinea sp.]|nr:ribokinase [Chryseolinea sp.]
MARPIYVIGSSNTDMVVKTEKLPMPGETVIGGTFFMNPGGKGANQAVAAARLGGRVTFIARVGADLFGSQALQQFQKENIDTRFVTQDPAYPSGVALIGVDHQGENTIIVAPGSNRQLSVKDVSTAFESIEENSIILIQLEIPKETVEFAILNGLKKKCEVILNPAPVQPVDGNALLNLSIITPNETEAEMLTGIHISDLKTAEQSALQLHQRGVQQVIITLGAKGAFVSTGSTAKLISAPKVTAVDTTAGGDCFNGALAVALAEGMRIEEAATFACGAASLSVTRMGAQSSMPYRKEIKV